MRPIWMDYVLLRSVVTLVVVMAVTLSAWLPGGNVSSAAEMPIGATLRVLALPVEIQAAQTDAFVAAMDGQMLDQGDVVRTGPGGLALLTFFDGSETELGGEAMVQIERAEATPAPQIALLQTAGVTLNHVVPMPPGGTFQTDTPAASGLVRGTSYVVVVGLGASESSGDAQTAAARDVPVDDAVAAAPQTAFTCGLSRDLSCATSVVLLTDRDGHVGRVDVAAQGSSEAAPVQLSEAGDAASSMSGKTAAGKVAGLTLQALEAGANARNLPDAARAAERHARVVAAALMRLTPSRPTPAPTVATREVATPLPASSPIVLDEPLQRTPAVTVPTPVAVQPVKTGTTDTMAEPTPAPPTPAPRTPAPATPDPPTRVTAVPTAPVVRATVVPSNIGTIGGG